jgi:hypothetical protein
MVEISVARLRRRTIEGGDVDRDPGIHRVVVQEQTSLCNALRSARCDRECAVAELVRRDVLIEGGKCPRRRLERTDAIGGTGYMGVRAGCIGLA